MTPEDRLAELGVTLPVVVPPVAVYVPAIRTGNYLYTSGQVPMRDGALIHQGLVGAEITPEQAFECAELCALNTLGAVSAELGSLSAVGRIVKVVGFVASADGFIGQPQVMNGASELLGKVFGEAGSHARSAVGVAQLPLGAPVEVETIIEIAD